MLESPVTKEGVQIPIESNNKVPSTNFQPLTEEANLYEQWKKRDLTHPLGTRGALFHLTKASIGTGILAMPMAFRNGGLWVSLCLALVIGVIYTHCVHILVHSSHVLSTRVKKPQLGFAEMAEVAFLTGPTSWRQYAAVARNIVDAGLFFNYYSCLGVYLLFVASTNRQVIGEGFDYLGDLRMYILVLLVVVLPVGLIRNLKYLVPLSFLALCGLTLCCGFVLYDVLRDLPPLSSRPAFTSFAQLPLFFSTVVFAVDGMGTALPIENSMRNPEYFLGCTGVLSISMVWTMTLYCTMGFFGYLHYGDATRASITLNLSSSFVSQAVKLIVAMNVLFSYFLYLFVPAEIVWRKLYPEAKGTRKMFYDYSARILLILGSVLLAVAVPNLEVFVGLVGAVGASSTMFFFPAVIDLVTFWEDKAYMGCYHWKMFKDILIIVLWLLTLTTGAHLSLVQILQLYR